MMLDAGFGVAPADVFFSGLAETTGLTVGTIVIASYLVMIAATWPVGVKPGIGTLFSVLLIGPAVDLTRLLNNHLSVDAWPLLGSIVWWLAGLIVFTTGVLGLFAANLGVSPYDQVTLAVSTLTKRTLGFARLLVDGTLLLIGALLGGSWGVGTVGLLLAVPFALNRLLPHARTLVQRSTHRQPVAKV